MKPPWQNVDPMRQSLFSYLKKGDDHLLLKSSRFHFQLEHIYPFADGNGRMGRLWQTCLLMAYHPIFEFLPIENFIKKRRNEYYKELAIGDDTGDCTGFTVFMLTIILASLQELMLETRSVTLTASDRLEMAARSFGESAFSRKDYQTIFKTISPATASRDLPQGVKTGLLEKTGNKRVTIYRCIG
jgi:Fic family protein